MQVIGETAACGGEEHDDAPSIISVVGTHVVPSLPNFLEGLTERLWIPYFVPLAGVVIMVLMWTSHAQTREQIRELERREQAGETNISASRQRNDLAG